MKIQTYVALDTVISKCNSDIENFDDYIKYLNNKVYFQEDVKSMFKHVTFIDTLFGKLFIDVYVDEIFNDSDGKADVFVDIVPENNLDEDFVYDNFDKQKVLLKFIEEQVVDFVNTLNNCLKTYAIPMDENLIFKGESFYMEISF